MNRTPVLLLVALSFICCRPECRTQLEELLPFTTDPNKPNCGLNVDQSSTSSGLSGPCIDGEVISGPRVLHSEYGQDASHEEVLTITEDGTLCITVHVAKQEQLQQDPAIKVTINGETLLTENSFQPLSTRAQATIPVAAGKHVLLSKASSNPNSEIKLSTTVRFSPLSDTMGPYPLDGNCGRMSMERPAASPSIPDIDQDTYDVSTDASGISSVITADIFSRVPLGNSPLILEYAIQIVQTETCELVRTLQGSVPVSQSQVATLSEEWDWRDEEGNVVEEGKYVFRVVVTLNRYNERLDRLRAIDHILSYWHRITREGYVGIQRSFYIDTGPNSPFDRPFGQVYPVRSTPAVLAQNGQDVYLINSIGTLSNVYDGDESDQPILHPFGDIFIVATPDKFTSYTPTGTPISATPIDDYLYLKAFHGPDEIVGYHRASWAEMEEDDVDSIEFISSTGSLVSSIPVLDHKVSQAGYHGNHIFISFDDTLEKWNRTGTRIWQIPASLAYFKPSTGDDRIISLSSADTRQVIHYNDDTPVGIRALPDVVSEIAISSSGKYSVAATRYYMVIFEDGLPLTGVSLPYKWVASVDVSDEGYVLVSGKYSDHKAEVGMYSKWGTRRWLYDAAYDDNGYRPQVRFMYSDDIFIVKQNIGLSAFNMMVAP